MLKKSKYRYQMYNQLQENRLKILSEARKVPDEIGIPNNLRKFKLGATGAVSGAPAQLPKDVMDAVVDASRKVIPLAALINEFREVIKDIYGDDYDITPINTCEAALWVTSDLLFAPPMLGRGDSYRARYIAPYERHMHHQAGYGRPFPPKYKAYISNRGVSPGELGMEGKRQYNLDAVIVPLVGAKYKVHGIKSAVVPLLIQVDPKKSIEKIREVAERHISMLTGFTSLGYDTPGYGYGQKSGDGAPLLQRLIGEVAEKYDVPYVVDNAWGNPSPIGTDARKINADIIMYSMDKAADAPTSGLIIGKEDVMVPIRMALGMHSERSGTVSSYGKAEYVTQDPGKSSIVGQKAWMEMLRDEPKRITDPIDDTYRIVKEEFEAVHSKFIDDIIITKSYNMAATEVNYEQTWKNREFGIPIFGIEDFYAGSDPIFSGMKAMGIFPTITYDGNIMISHGLGTTDEEGHLIKDRMRYVVKGLVRMLEIVCKYAGVLEEVEIRA